MSNLNLKKFKKISHDGKTATFQHDDGHTIKIAIDKLSPKLKKEVEGLPIIKKEVKHFAEGGDASSVDQTDNQTSPPINININGQPTNIPQNIPNGIVLDPAKVAQAQQQNQVTLPSQQQASREPAASLAPPKKQEEDVEEPITASTAAAQPSQPEQQSQPDQISAIQPVDKSEEYQKSYADYQKSHAAEMGQEDAAFAHDLQNGHITPQTYHSMFAKKDTLGKIGTIFGMMLSGAGSGLSHQPNALLEAMKNEINNDLAAQTTSKGNAQNFLKINQQQALNEAHIKLQASQGKLTEAQAKSMLAEANLKAYTLANMQMNRTLLHNQVLQVQKMPEGPQKEQAKQVLSMMGMAVNGENFNLADSAAAKLALMQSVNGDNGQVNTTGLKMMGQEKLAEDIEKKHIPGFQGQASEPLNPTEKKELRNYAEFDAQLGRYIDWAKQHSGIAPTSPENIATIKQGQTLARQLQSKYRETALNTVYRPGEQPLLDQTIDSEPTKFLNKWRVVPQLEALRKENSDQLNTAAKTYGFKGYSGFNKQAQAGGGSKYQEGQTASDANGNKLIFKNGAWVKYGR